MRPASLTRQLIAATAAIGLTLSSAFPAAAASPQTTSGWSVSQTFGPADGVWGDTFAADSPSDAWTTWVACGPCSGNPTELSYLDHWNGSAWSPVTVPAGLAKYAQNPLSIGASSASNAWLFDPHDVLRWNGTTWSLRSIPDWVVHSNLSGETDIQTAVFSPDSVWVFSLGTDSITSPAHYAAEYNGKTWSKVTLPGVPDEVSVVTADDIWVLGVTPSSVTSNNPDYILMHWNGTSWSSTALPTVTPPKNTIEDPGGLAGTGASDAWVPWSVTRGTAGAVTTYLLHWDGTSWARVKLGLPISEVSDLTQDGHGGLWLDDNGPAPDYTWYLDHLSGGKWTRDTVPVASGDSLLELSGVTSVPGSSSVWAQGDMTSGSNIYGAILRYNP
jgi:hypothetical protein